MQSYDGPQSPEETTTPAIYALAAQIGTEVNRLSTPISEMEAIGIAEKVDRGYREEFADDLEAADSPLCDCSRETSTPISPTDGAEMAHHCDCAAVTASRVLRLGETRTRHARACWPRDEI
jgi:hypothetical protein